MHQYLSRRLTRRGRWVLISSAVLTLALGSTSGGFAATPRHHPSSALGGRATTTRDVGQRGQLVATATLSEDDVWSVGGTDQPGHSHGGTLIEHWDGHRWRRVKSPNVRGAEVSSLNSISAVSPDDIWVSGGGADESGAVVNLMEHWDGHTWKAVDAPNNPASDINYLQSVSADSTGDAWAAADYVNAEGVWIPYAEHWNGHDWSIVSVPQPGGSLQTFLTGVVAIAPDDAWIVGQCIDSQGVPVTLTEHWNGTEWTVVSSPNPQGVQASGLSAADASTSGDVWAAGNSTTSAGRTKTLVEHWNGTEWSLVPSPNPQGGGGSTLDAITAGGSDATWAVGETQQNSGVEHTLILRWTGSEWVVVPSPNVEKAQASSLTGVSSTSATNAWATGSSYAKSGAAATLNLAWNGRHWKISG